MFEQFGPYRVVQQIGRGGMGAVYEGHDAETDRRCAIKVLAPIFADDEDFRARFQLEIETLKQLDHPNIVHLQGYGEQDGHLFYTMELVEGPNLQQQAQQGTTFTWEQVVDFAIQICAALKHAHDRGIIHRDLKPANLIWSDNATGPLKLTDFGIAKLFGSTQVTLAGGVVGTVDYMSPEQAHARPVTARSDLYSLGSVMYSLLAKRPPFRGSSKTQVLDSLIHEQPLPISRLVYGIPDELEEIIERLLAKDPAERIATALSLSNRLKAMMHAHRKGVLERDDEGTDEFEVDLDKPRAVGQTLAAEGSEIGHDDDDLGKTRATSSTRHEGSDILRPPPPRGNYDETVISSPPSSATEIEGEEHSTTTFTPVEEAPARQRQETTRPEQHRGDWRSIAALAAGLLLLGAAAWQLSRPAPAGKLYQEINAVAASGDHARWADVRDKIDAFITHHPEDRRHAQVMAWREDHEWYKLWRKLEREARKQGGLEYLGPCQQAFVAAARLDNQGQNSEAAAAYRDAVAACRGDEPQIQRCRQSAAHRLEQLGVSEPAATAPES